MSLLNDIRNARKNNTTYRVGLLQTKAYRKLKQRTNDTLKPYKISSIEWAYLGMLHEYKDGIRPNDIADIIGVKAPFITSLSSRFEKEGTLKHIKDTTDGRAKKILLTQRGHALVIEIEALLRTESKKWLKGVSAREIITFLKVLAVLSKD